MIHPPHLLIIFGPFPVREIHFREDSIRFCAFALPNALDLISVCLINYNIVTPPTLGSNPVNSNPLQSKETNGAKLPFASAEYGWGATASNFAELSRLHRPHLHTKWAVLPFPPETSRSSWRNRERSKSDIFDISNRRPKTDETVHGYEVWMCFIATSALHLHNT